MKIFFLNPAYGRDFCKSARWFCKSRGRVQRHPDFLCEAIAVAQQAGHGCKFIDGAARNILAAETQDMLKGFSPDLVVIQVTTPSIYSDISYAKIAKDTLGKDCLTVMVGAHVSAEPADTLQKAKGAVDILARREYDYTLTEIASGKKREDIAGISYLEGGTVVHNPDRAFVEEVDGLPMPAWEHINPYDYHDAGKLYPFITIIGSRGCFGRCTFCLFPQVMYGRKYRPKSAKRFVDEIEYDLKLFPFLKEIMFEDDTFVSVHNIERAKAICALLLERGLKFTWSANARPDSADLPVLKLMKKAGCRMLCVGYEFGDSSLLDAVKKGISQERMREFSYRCKEAGIMLHGCFMIGGPGETAESARRTIKFASELPLNTAQFSGVCAYPGTEFYSWCKTKNCLITKDWPDWVDEKLEQRTIVSLPGLSDKEINLLIDEGLKRFYLRPSQLLNILTHLDSWADIKTKIYGFRSFFDYFNKRKKAQGQGLREEWGHFWKRNNKETPEHTSWSKRRILQVLEPYVKPGMRVLDAGCGSGFFSRYFLSRGCLTYALDYSQEALSLTRSATDGKAAKYICEDLLDVNLAALYAGSFDLIFSDGLFEHFPRAEQNKLMYNFEKMKKEGGRIITFVPNKCSFWHIISPLYMRGIREIPFTPSKLVALHEESGLRIAKRGGVNVLPVYVSPERLFARHIGMLLFCVAE